MQKFGIIGRNIQYSQSPVIHQAHFEAMNKQADYRIIDTDNLFSEIVHIRQLSGFNVTTPYKEHILTFCDVLSDEVKAIGACNTIKVENKLFTAYNTDCDGFYRLLLNNKLVDLPKATKVLIIGAGGAAKAVYYTLNQLGYDITVTNRTPSKAQFSSQVCEFSQVNTTLNLYDLVINATSVGVTRYESPIIISHIKEKSTFIDLNYQETLKFLDDGHKLGAKTINGSDMLIYQAAKSYEIWFKEPASIEVIEAAIRRK